MTLNLDVICFQTSGKVRVHSFFLVPHVLTLLYTEFLPYRAFETVLNMIINGHTVTVAWALVS